MPGKRSTPQGFILPLSLLILASVTAITASLTRGLFSGISVARGTSAAVTAYFAAETGVEKAFYKVKTLRLAATSTFQNAIDTLNAPSFSGVLAGPNASFTVSASKNESLNLGLKENQVATVDLFDPDDLLTGGGVGCLGLDAEDANPSPVNTTVPWLEVTYVVLTPAGPDIGLDPTVAVETLLESDRLNPLTTQLAVNNLPKQISIVRTKNYRVRIKALYDDVKQLVVTPYQNTCAPGVNPLALLESRLVIKVVGAYPANTSSTRQAITASANWLTPASPLFDYALFSEEAIEKR